jgi:hypothetical protein
MAANASPPTRVVRFYGSTDDAHDALTHREATFAGLLPTHTPTRLFTERPPLKSSFTDYAMPAETVERRFSS